MKINHAAGAVSSGEVRRSTPEGRRERAQQLRALSEWYRRRGRPTTAFDYQRQANALEAET